MRQHELLNLAADVLEKTAEYLDSIDTVNHRNRVQEHQKKANEIKTQLAQTLGETVNDSVADKLASLDSDVQTIIGKVLNASPAESMGSASDTLNTAKTASYKENGVGPAEAQFIEWFNT
jgi:hypothetical protein